MSYLGAKSGSGVYQAIINLMPPHDTYVEPFLGTGAVMQRKPMTRRSIGIDKDKSMVDKFRCSYPVELLTQNSIKWLGDFEANDRTVIYCDPPYIHKTRTSNKRYTYEFSDDDHKELLKTLVQFKDSVYILISSYQNALYDEYLHDWWSVDFQAMTRGGVRTETVWCNFEPSKIHYHTYAGKNFTDRQRIKRKAERWAKNFTQLPAYERQAVLAAILETEAIL